MPSRSALWRLERFASVQRLAVIAVPVIGGLGLLTLATRVAGVDLPTFGASSGPRRPADTAPVVLPPVVAPRSAEVHRFAPASFVVAAPAAAAASAGGEPVVAAGPTSPPPPAVVPSAPAVAHTTAAGRPVEVAAGRHLAKAVGHHAHGDKEPPGLQRQLAAASTSRSGRRRGKSHLD